MELTNEEKLAIIQQHLKSILYNEYNAVLSLNEARAVTKPQQAAIDNFNTQLVDIRSQKDALQKELDNINDAISAENTKA